MPSSAALHSLRQRLETLPFTATWKHMLDIGRSCVEDTDLQDVIETLARSSEHYERMLAAMAFRGAVAVTAQAQPQQPVPPAVLKACRELALDPSTKISKLVREPVVLVSSDAELTALLRRAPTKLYSSICKTIRDAKRGDTVFAAVAQAVPPHLTTTPARPEPFPYAKRMLLARYMSREELQHLSQSELTVFPPGVVVALTDRHPEAMHAKLMQYLQESLPTDTAAEDANPDGDVRSLSSSLSLTLYVSLCTYGRSCKATSRRLGLSILERCLPQLQISQRQLRTLLERYLEVTPHEVCRYVLTISETVRDLHLRFGRRLRKKMQSAGDLVVQLVVLGVFARSPFQNFTPDVRRRLYKEHRSTMEGSTGGLDQSFLTALPDPEDRIAEAVKAYSLAAMAERPVARIDYLKVLPFPLAYEMGKPFITNPKPELRIATIEALVYGVRYHPEHFIAVMDHIKCHQKEQDPWRCAMAHALSELPLRVWGETPMRYLDDMLQTAVDATDISCETMQNYQKLLVRTIAKQPAHAMQHIMHLMRRSEFNWAAGVGDSVSPEMTRYMLRVMMPELLRMVHHTDGRGVARATGIFKDKCLRHCKDIMRPLYAACVAGNNATLARFGLLYFSRHFYSEFCTAIVPHLLTTDRSAILVQEVRQAVSRDIHGDVMLPFLKPIFNLSGKFVEHRCNSDEYHYIAFQTSYAYRWAAGHQHLYAQTMCASLEQHFKQKWWKIRCVLPIVGSLPSASAEDGILPYTAENFEDIFTRDLAISVLGRMNDAASIAELLKGLEDTRQREAVFSILTRFRSRQPVEAIGVLERVLLTSKLVNVRKMIVRFIGDLACPEAYQCLRRYAVAKGNNIHADVKIALMRSYWNYLEEPTIWELYDEAARSTRAADAIALASIPQQCLVASWQVERMNAVLGSMLGHEDLTVKQVAIQKINSCPRFQSTHLYECLCRCLTLPEECSIIDYAVRCILQFNDFPIEDTAQLLASTPNDRVLARVVTALSRALVDANHRAQHLRLRQCAFHITKALLLAGRQPSLAARLIVSGSVAHWETHFAEMQRRSLVHPGASAAALAALNDLVYTSRLNTIAAMEERTLRQHADAFCRRLGLEVVTMMLTRYNATPAIRQAIAVYRKDPDQWVRDEATLVTLPPEQ